MEARRVLAHAVEQLVASPAIDHWQRGRERIEAEDLLGYVLGDEPEPGDEVSGANIRRFSELVARRVTGEPIAFIKGYADFRGLELIATPGVFVQRDSSEFLAEQAIRRLRGRQHPVHVDLATGGGAIALAVANEAPGTEVWGVDVADDAVRLARRNARALELEASFRVGDLFGGLPARLRGSVDVITLHPPYVPVGELDDLPGEIRDWEPSHTLTDDSADGMGLITRTVSEAPQWLRSSGWLLIEVSPDRARDVKRAFTAGGFRDVRSTRGGELQVTRVIVGRRPR
ncbi:MAG TPA: HemK/PrmC family methyltransferase [Actinomycetota bacterium]